MQKTKKGEKKKKRCRRDIKNIPSGTFPQEAVRGYSVVEEAKRYWGRHFWARGYFCATVGPMTEEMIEEYLEHHFEPKPNDKFKVELEPNG